MNLLQWRLESISAPANSSYVIELQTTLIINTFFYEGFNIHIGALIYFVVV